MKIKNWMLFVLVALFAVPAFAQHDIMMEEVAREDQVMVEDSWYGTYDLNGTYMDNPCTWEEDWTLVDYDVALYQEHWKSATSGSEGFFFDEGTTMSSSQYGAYGSSQSDVSYDTSFTLRQYHKVNTWDNFHVVTVIDFDPASHQTYVSVETACGDGTPNSAQ